MRSVSIYMVLAALLVQCGRHDKKTLLQGSWKTDSVYSYYNGFWFTRHDITDEPMIHYQPDGKLMMTRREESRMFSYIMPHNDSLIYRDTVERNLERFLILKIDTDQLILRKELRPVFNGDNQQRYEIRYLSRVIFSSAE